MGEGALELRVAAHLTDDLGAKKRLERLARRVAADPLEHRDRERPPDGRRDLGEPARLVGLSVDPRYEKVLERRRKQLERADRHRPRAPSRLERSLEVGARELLQVERVSLRLADESGASRRVDPVTDDAGEHLRRPRPRRAGRARSPWSCARSRRAHEIGARRLPIPESAPRSGRARSGRGRSARESARRAGASARPPTGCPRSRR